MNRSKSLLPWSFACALWFGAAAAAPPEMPPPEVEVVTAERGDVTLERELVGRLMSRRVAEVRARVAGVVLERSYTEGTDVGAGQLLFRIDPQPLEAAVAAAEAALARAEADAANATLIARRQRDLLQRKLAAPQDVDSAVAAEDSARAAVQEARATLRQARIDLGYATVTAPIAGRAGRALVTEGALVGEGEATPLTTIEQIDPIYLGFGQTVTDFQRLRANTAPGTMPEVTVVMPDGSVYDHRGQLDFSDVNVDAGSGMVLLRATIPNPDHALLPGMYVKLRYAVGRLHDAVELPHAAVLRDRDGAYVMTVGSDGKVARRAVEVRDMRDTTWVVTGELGDGEQVIVQGLQKVRPGAPARIVAPAPAAAAS
ncbi:MAG: efflux RND transporter periplasmic adaptor subunit [Gammaproteobacteria bacterium]|nr:efflux RND transporter periplasmic adaptor subunit [Gammaproteobacteria bacterium]MCP5201782.1 efflux RND transporter periplasmic adaptor subunit [Gammaproteobacteria bacterium]